VYIPNGTHTLTAGDPIMSLTATESNIKADINVDIEADTATTADAQSAARQSFLPLVGLHGKVEQNSSSDPSTHGYAWALRSPP